MPDLKLFNPWPWYPWVNGPRPASTWRPRSESAPGPLERRDDNTGN